MRDYRQVTTLLKKKACLSNSGCFPSHEYDDMMMKKQGQRARKIHLEILRCLFWGQSLFLDFWYPAELYLLLPLHHRFNKTTTEYSEAVKSGRAAGNTSFHDQIDGLIAHVCTNLCHLLERDRL